MLTHRNIEPQEVSIHKVMTDERFALTQTEISY